MTGIAPASPGHVRNAEMHSQAALTRERRVPPKVAERYSNFTNKNGDSDKFADFFNDAECFYQTKFEGNHVYGFLKTDLSWHSIENVELPAGHSRNSINISINRTDYEQGS